MKRVVTDVLWVEDAPIAFNQLSHKSKKYEGVCPWCAGNLGRVKASTYRELYIKLFPAQLEHMYECKGQNFTEMSITIKGK